MGHTTSSRGNKKTRSNGDVYWHYLRSTLLERTILAPRVILGEREDIEDGMSATEREARPGCRRRRGALTRPINWPTTSGSSRKVELELTTPRLVRNGDISCESISKKAYRPPISAKLLTVIVMNKAPVRDYISPGFHRCVINTISD
jgi:hypothetical protein